MPTSSASAELGRVQSEAAPERRVAAEPLANRRLLAMTGSGTGVTPGAYSASVKPRPPANGIRMIEKNSGDTLSTRTRWRGTPGVSSSSNAVNGRSSGCCPENATSTPCVRSQLIASRNSSLGARVGVADAMRHQPCGDDAVRIDAEIDGIETAQRSHEDAAAGEQHERHRDLHDDERAAQTPASGQRSATLLDDSAEIGARREDRRQEAEYQERDRRRRQPNAPRGRRCRRRQRRAPKR